MSGADDHAAGLIRRLDGVVRQWKVVAFALAYPLQPLFFTNQNTYLVHAVAALDHRLDHDWLATVARDPVPLFTALSKVLLFGGGHAGIYAATLAIFALYSVSLTAIVVRALGLTWGARATPWIIVGIVAIHSPMFEAIVGPAVSAAVVSGVADQYVLGPAFQPSTAGVLLLFGIACYQRHRWWLSMGAFAAAIILHPTYALHSCILVSGIIVAHRRDRSQFAGAGRPTLVFGAVLALVAVWQMSFVSGSVEEMRQAQAILVDWRFPHHARPAIWGPHASTALQIGLMIAAPLMVKDSSTRRLLWWSVLLGSVLSVLAALSRSELLALTFPWRISTILVPMAAALAAGTLVVRVTSAPESPAARWGFNAIAPGVCLAILIAGGLIRTRANFAAESDDVEHRMARQVRNEAPVTYLVPLAWQDFRLVARVPIVADYKSNPYRASDVIEWFRRINDVRPLYEGGGCGAWMQVMRRYDAQAVVAPKDALSNCPAVKLIATDADYSRYVRTE